MKIGNLEIAWNEWRGWRTVLPYKRLLLALLLVAIALYVCPRVLFTREIVDVLGVELTAWTFVVGLLSASLLCVAVLSDTICWFRKRRLFKGRDAGRRIDALTPYSKGVIRAMYETDTKSRKLNVLEATWAELKANQMIGWAEYGLRNRNELECYLKFWVRSYLDEHAKYLEQLPVIKEEELPF